MRIPTLLLIASSVIAASCADKSQSSSDTLDEMLPEEEADGPVPPARVSRVLPEIWNVTDRMVMEITGNALKVSGRPLVPVRAGKVPKREQPQGVVIPRFLDKLTKLRADIKTLDTQYYLAVHPDTSFGLLYSVMATAHRAGMARHATVAVVGPSGVCGLTLTLPKPSDMIDTTQHAALQLVLTVSESRAVLWSKSGLEGTFAQPSVERSFRGAPSDDDVQAIADKLRDIVDRRFPGERSLEDSQIIVQMSPDVPFGIAANWFAVAHVDPQGRSLFPILLMSQEGQ